MQYGHCFSLLPSVDSHSQFLLLASEILGVKEMYFAFIWGKGIISALCHLKTQHLQMQTGDPASVRCLSDTVWLSGLGWALRAFDHPLCRGLS